MVLMIIGLLMVVVLRIVIIVIARFLVIVVVIFSILISLSPLRAHPHRLICLFLLCPLPADLRIVIVTSFFELNILTTS